jgi:hypothetical protein
VIRAIGGIALAVTLAGVAHADAYLLGRAEDHCAPADDRSCHGTFSRYGDSGPWFDENAYVGLLYKSDFTGAGSTMARVTYRDFGVALRGTLFYAGRDSDQHTIGLWVASATHRFSLGPTMNLWIDLGAAGAEARHGGALGGRFEYVWRNDLELAAEARGYLVAGGSAIELVASVQLSLFRVSYHVFRLASVDHEWLAGPELGLAFRF